MSYQNESYQNGDSHPATGNSSSASPTHTGGGSAAGGRPSNNIQYTRIGEENYNGGMRDSCFRSAAQYRWLEAVFLLGILFVGTYYPGPLQKMYVPQVTSLSTLSAGTVVANNTAFSYPVILDGNVCSPFILSQCADGDDQAKHHGCCHALRAGHKPYQTVPEETLNILVTVIPLSLLLIRYLIFCCWLKSDQGILLRDSLIGYWFALCFNEFTTNFIKNAIGYPRPNHFALILVASQSKYTSMAENAWKSFPSGHSSLSMATMLYTTLILLHDVKRKSNSLTSVARSMLVGLAWLPVFLAIFIAATRVTNMFHATTDVLAGLFLGASWAIVSYRHVLPGNELYAKAKDHHTISDIADVLSYIL